MAVKVLGTVSVGAIFAISGWPGATASGLLAILAVWILCDDDRTRRLVKVIYAVHMAKEGWTLRAVSGPARCRAAASQGGHPGQRKRRTDLPQRIGRLPPARRGTRTVRRP